MAPVTGNLNNEGCPGAHRGPEDLRTASWVTGIGDTLESEQRVCLTQPVQSCANPALQGSTDGRPERPSDAVATRDERRPFLHTGLKFAALLTRSPWPSGGERSTEVN